MPPAQPNKPAVLGSGTRVTAGLLIALATIFIGLGGWTVYLAYQAGTVLTEINGRLAVIYSREDLSAGMVGETIDGIIGYTPDTATALMTRIILYVAK